MISPDRFFRVCDSVAGRIVKALAPVVGTPYGAEEICIGADNTPTERLDKIAEDIVLEAFRENKVCARMLSEEAGMVDIGGQQDLHSYGCRRRTRPRFGYYEVCL